MNNDTNHLEAAIRELRLALDTGFQGRVPTWISDVHVALGQLAVVLQEEVPGSEETMKNVGNANPNFRNVPGTERHVQKTRHRFIQLGEMAHQLRAELRADARQVADPLQLRRRVDPF